MGAKVIESFQTIVLILHIAWADCTLQIFTISNYATTLYYLLREQDRLTILKFFYHPVHTKSTLFT